MRISTIAAPFLGSCFKSLSVTFYIQL